VQQLSLKRDYIFSIIYNSKYSYTVETEESLCAWLVGMRVNSGTVLPNVEIVASDVYCPGQQIDITFTNDHIYNAYEVYIQRLKGNGSIDKEFLILGDKGTEIPDIFDLLQGYKQRDPTYVFNCNDKFKIVVKLFATCSDGAIIEKLINFSCSDADIAYPNFIICGESQNVLITGVNSCDNCTIEWSAIEGPQGIGIPSGNFLDNKTIKFPTIMGQNFVGAYNFKYMIQAINADGSVFKDVIEILDYGKLDIEIGSNITHLCSFDSISKLKYEYPIDFMKFVDVIYYIVANYGNYPPSGPVLEENLPIYFIPGQPKTTKDLLFKPTLIRLLRGFDHEIRIELIPKQGVKLVNVGCGKTKELSRLKDSPYFGKIQMYVPNAFYPGGTAIDDKTIHPYFYENVFQVWFKVFDRWGEKIHNASIKATNNNALTVDDLETISFAGNFNGQEIDEQVLVFVVDYQNCQVSPADCFSDDEGGINASGIIAPMLNNLSQVTLPFEKMASGAGLWTCTGSSEINKKNCIFSSPPPVAPSSLIYYNYCTIPTHKCQQDNQHSDEIHKL